MRNSFKAIDTATPALSDALERIRVLQQVESQRQLVLTNWCLRHLLKFWQSELEPEVIYGPDFELRGIGYAGRVIVPLRWLAHVDLSC